MRGWRMELRRALRSSLAAALCALSVGCASYRGTARDAEATRIASDAGWIRVEAVPVVRQHGQKDCGAAALSAVLGYWGREVSVAEIDTAARRASERGIRAEQLRRYAEAKGLSAFVFFGKFEDIEYELARGRPVIVGTAKPMSSDEALAHYEVVVGYHPKRRKVLTVDPARGLREYELEGFLAEWGPTQHLTLVVFEAKTSG